MRAYTHGCWGHIDNVESAQHFWLGKTRSVLVLLTGFEPRSFGSFESSQRSTNWATPSPQFHFIDSQVPLEPKTETACPRRQQTDSLRNRFRDIYNARTLHTVSTARPFFCLLSVSSVTALVSSITVTRSDKKGHKASVWVILSYWGHHKVQPRTFNATQVSKLCITPKWSYGLLK